MYTIGIRLQYKLYIQSIIVNITIIIIYKYQNI